ncbi:hypothetical protein L873DRAFT_1790188 [Choiromyces venosus 120613-1]|uniref:Uncharacterized protein n=1 Tax=Choiromyces venosus 120613-1 TaxID=1336337 RepID=A0A3N4JK12_9PEZI|nr:hypothetical protein L873DRAFT_1790188 [Choiromyces venosus 120613-1]
MSLPLIQDTLNAMAHQTTPPPSPLGGPRSPMKSPRPYSPSLLPPRSPHGVPLQTRLPMFFRIEHTVNCPNKAINVGNRIVAQGSTFFNVHRELGCNKIYYVQLANMAPAIDTSLRISTPLPGFYTSLQKIFGDQIVDMADQEALAQLAAHASSFQPPQESPITVSQIPASSPLDTHMNLVLYVQVPDSQPTADIPMSLGNGQNSDGTGIGDSQHAATSQELPRRVRFSSPIVSFTKTREIPATDSGNFTPEQTKTTLMPKSKKGKEKAVEGPGNTLAPLILTGDDGETILDLSTPELIREYMGSGTALTTNVAVTILLTNLEDSLTQKMNEMENRLMAAIQEKRTG